MKSTVAIYDSHWTALDAVEVLKNKSFPIEHLSIIGQAKGSNDNQQKKTPDPLLNASASIAVVLDSTLAVLSRARILPVAEVGFLFGAGAIVGVLGTSDLDLSKAGIASILRTIGIEKENALNYSEHLKEGKFLVVANGEDEEVEKAKNIIWNSAKPIELVIN